jgi:outer membrane protein TolC
MNGKVAKYVLLTVGLLAARTLSAQKTPPASNQAWHSKSELDVSKELAVEPQPSWSVDSSKFYTLPELIDLAEQHNPETRASWERAKSRAAELGIARSAYFPTLTASVYAASLRQPALIDGYFHRQTIALYQPTLIVEYLIFDLGGRAGAVDVAKANLIVANLAFNDTHRRLIYDVSAAYFRLLNATGQREAAEVSLKNAETVEADADNRLTHGLATRPDLLEASAARAQADFELQAAVGAEAIARGHLVTLMGLPSETDLKVQSLSELSIPHAAGDSLNEEIERAFHQRPELLEAVARIRAARGMLKQAKSAYFPTLQFSGNGGLARGYGQEDLIPGHYAEGEVWNAGLDLRWTLFDGARREEEVIAAKAQRRAAEADLHALRDQIDEEVFTSYTNLETALRQQQAATALLTASVQSYEAAREAYGYGLRSELDVIAAQKALAQARSEDVAARSQLLLQAADLAFRTGDMIQVHAHLTRP